MILIPSDYVRMFPLIPGGGLFFLPIGICIVAGAFFPRARMVLVWIGIGAGVLAIVLGGRFFKGLPPPTGIQVACFVVAIVAEAVAFRLLIPRLRPLGEHQALVGSLAIVGAHFLIMIPAFGWPIAMLAFLCLANALAAHTLTGYPIAAAWFLDGVFKLGVGLAMWTASPLFAVGHGPG